MSDKHCVRCHKNYENTKYMFCGNCGDRLQDITTGLPAPYNNPLGWWDVSTEGDCEGKTMKKFGTFYGYVDEIAQKIAASAGVGYSLCFVAVNEPVLPKPPKGTFKKAVNISFGSNSKTWGGESKHRAALIAKTMKDRPVKVVPSTYYAAVQLQYPEPSAE